MIKILIIEPYYTGSHKHWIDGYKKYSNHEIKVLTLKGQFWKWRMHGGAVTLAEKFKNLKWTPDLIITSDMLDLTTFLALTRRETRNIRTLIYFHENQISYPWSPNDRDVQKNRNFHYGFINFISCLASDHIFFNSNFHMNSFYTDLTPFLKNFPDHNEINLIKTLKNKSEVLYVGLDLKSLGCNQKSFNHLPTILWNHRWEYDKNPESFFKILKKVKQNNYKFKLIILGEKFTTKPEIFTTSKKIFENEIIQWGYLNSKEEYIKHLWKADIMPVTSKQEFFGISVMEGIYCETWPILPNRLTYPELIPKEYHSENLYDSDDDLYKKLIFAINNYQSLKKINLQHVVKKYDWTKIASKYDSVFQKASNK